MSRSRIAVASALATTAFFTLACGNGAERDAGPHSSEYGDVLFWDVVRVEAELIDCPDTELYQDILAEQPFIEGGVIAYKLGESGSTADLMDCTEYDADACTKVSGVFFTVDGHEMKTMPQVDQAAQQGTCALILTDLLTLTDRGEEATMTESIKHALVGTDDEDCDALDEVYADDDGVGVSECQVLFTANLVFAAHDRL